MFFNKKKKIKELENKVLQLENLKLKTALELDEYIKEQECKKNNLIEEINKYKTELNELTEKIDIYTDTIVFSEIGLYEPIYNFMSSLEAKEKLLECRKEQKEMIKQGIAVNTLQEITYNGSKSEGKKALKSFTKQMLRCFNFECQVIIDKVTIKNILKSEQKIKKSYEDINKFNEKYASLNISQEYLRLKIEELYIAYEYALKVEEEKEKIREQKAKEKEERILQKEINTRKKIIDKDIKHYEKIIEELKNKLEKCEVDSEKEELIKEIQDKEKEKEEKNKEKEELDYRQSNATAGYVYIISNIGAFGKDVVKIGVTRRLDPMERINELSSASVPFKFDVHALIFSDDAFKLESEMHTYFNNYRLNKINLRKEFFRIPIDKIELKLEEYKNLTINFNREASAEEYYQSLSLEKNK